MNKTIKTMSLVWMLLVSIIIATQACDSEQNIRQEAAEQIDYTLQYATVAPYFRSTLTSDNQEEMRHDTKLVKEIAERFAAELGLKLAGVRTNAGLYQGGAELSYTYLLPEAPQEEADLFAALMGDLSAEYQDAVIACNYVTDNDTAANAIALLYTLPEQATIESVTADLNEAGTDGTANFDEGELQIICFSDEESQRIAACFEQKSAYRSRGVYKQNSRYLENGDRQRLYERGMVKYKENVTLYCACAMALAVCQATEGVAEEDRLEAAREAARKWDNEHPFSL